MTRRERAQRRLLSDLGSLSKAEKVVMCRTLDAYETELAADLESEETVQRVAEMVWGRFPRRPPYVIEAQATLVRVALRTLLEKDD